MKRTYRLTDPACAADLVIDLNVDDEDDPAGASPWADVDSVDELLNWWTDPKGRGYITIEDGYGQVIVDASSGEPNIMTWPDIDDERFELEYFPFPSLDFWLEGTDK